MILPTAIRTKGSSVRRLMRSTQEALRFIDTEQKIAVSTTVLITKAMLRGTLLWRYRKKPLYGFEAVPKSLARFATALGGI